jgi:hypothetical protein
MNAYSYIIHIKHRHIKYMCLDMRTLTNKMAKLRKYLTAKIKPGKPAILYNYLDVRIKINEPVAKLKDL